MLKKEDGQLDFRKSALALERQVRAFQPWPGSFATLDGKLLKVQRVALGSGHGEPGEVMAAGPAGLEVACGEGSLVLLQVQPEGKRLMTAGEFLAGHRIHPGDRPFRAQ
jgi:methionyl-tRNA formyltransferase